MMTAEDTPRTSESHDQGSHHGDHLITIIFDGNEVQVRSGEWIVRDLKFKLGVDQALVLAEITPQGLKDLEDGSKIKLHEKERFMAHARSGGSSK